MRHAETPRDPALYVHLPFCRTICPYCDFTVARYAGGNVGGYVDALARELCERSHGLRPRWIYVGGGTPTDTNASETANILEAISAAVDTRLP